VAWACDDPFLPLAESEVQLSVFGYLDAAADTQWVRVMPIRPLALTSPDSFGIIVTLENLGSGQTVELRDSLFTYSHNLDPGPGPDKAIFIEKGDVPRLVPSFLYDLVREILSR